MIYKAFALPLYLSLRRMTVGLILYGYDISLILYGYDISLILYGYDINRYDR